MKMRVARLLCSHSACDWMTARKRSHRSVNRIRQLVLSICIPSNTCFFRPTRSCPSTAWVRPFLQDFYLLPAKGDVRLTTPDFVVLDNVQQFVHELIVIKTLLFYLDWIVSSDVILCILCMHDFPVCSFNPAFRGCQNPINGCVCVT